MTTLPSATPQEHRNLVEKYRQTQTGVGWHSAPDDGYLYDHLAFHLKEAELNDELKALFADPNWMHVRVETGDYGNHLADLQVAWESGYHKAVEQITADEEATAFLECLHYALIETSIRSWAQSRTPSIVARALEVGLCTAEQAISIAELIPDEDRRARMFAALAKTGKMSSDQTGAATTEALEAAKNIKYPMSRAMTLELISKQTEAEQQHEALSAALEADLQAADGMFGSNGYGLSELIRKLPEDLLEHAESGVLALKNVEAKAWALAALAERVPEDRRYGVLQQGLEAALQIRESDVVKANAFARLADQLTGDQVNRALDAILALEEGQWRPRAIAGLMKQLNAEQVARVLESMLTIPDEWWRADGLMCVVEHSTGEIQRRALLALLTPQDGRAWAKIRGWLEHFASIELLETAISVANELDNPKHRSNALVMLNALLTTRKKGPAITSLPDLVARAEALMAQAAKLTGTDQSQQMLNALTIIYKIEDEVTREQLMRHLAEIEEQSKEVPQDLDEKELEDVLNLPYEEERSQALAKLAKRLPDHLLPRALDAALALDETLYRDWAFDGLANRLDNGLLLRALEGRFDDDDMTARVYALQKLAKGLQEPLRSEALTYALDCVFNIGNPYWRMERLQNLLPDLNGELTQKAAEHLYEVSQTLSIREITVYAKTIAADYLAGDIQTKALNEALDTVWTYEDPPQIAVSFTGLDPMFTDTQNANAKFQRARIAVSLLKHLEGEEKERMLASALDLVLSIQNETWQHYAMMQLMPFLHGEAFNQIIDRVLELKHEGIRTESLVNLIPHLPPSDYSRMVDAANIMSNVSCRAEILIALATRMEGEEREQLLGQAYEAALQTERKWSRVRLLADLAALRVSDSLERGLKEAQGAVDEADRTQILSLFLPLVSDTSDTLKQLRRGMLDWLNTLRKGNRAAIFWYCCDETIFTPPILSEETLTRLTEDILDISRSWQWTTG